MESEMRSGSNTQAGLGPAPSAAALSDDRQRFSNDKVLSNDKGLSNDTGRLSIIRAGQSDSLGSATHRGHHTIEPSLADAALDHGRRSRALAFSKGVAHDRRGLVAGSLTVGADGDEVAASALPAPPAVGSPELIGEMGEVYALAMLRDVPLTHLRHDGVRSPEFTTVLDALNELPWFQRDEDFNLRDASAALRRRVDFGRQTAFRGLAPGDDIGPYVSQFLLAGDTGIGDDRSESEGLIQFGAQTISQRVRRAASADFLTDWETWLAIQNGAEPASAETYLSDDRFITTGRDLATYVHLDSPCQAYTNAALLLFASDTPADPGLADSGLPTLPQLLSLIGEVCQRVAAAMKIEKYVIHRRLRPEELAGRIEASREIGLPELLEMRAALDTTALMQLRSAAEPKHGDSGGEPSYLLPVAYAEGAPQSPAHGSTHAAVAGGCVSVLKAFFDHRAPVTAAGAGTEAFVVSDSGDALQRVAVFDPFGNRSEITVEGELNKLAANVGMGRCWAGVQYFSSYWESALFGEVMAIDVLSEFCASSNGDVSLSVPRFDGGVTRI